MLLGCAAQSYPYLVQERAAVDLACDEMAVLAMPVRRIDLDEVCDSWRCVQRASTGVAFVAVCDEPGVLSRRALYVARDGGDRIERVR